MSKSKALYIHVPFCASVCAYCDFYRFRYNSDRADLWLAQVRKDLNNIQDEIATVYIGGGTPSVLSVPQLEGLLECTERFLPVKEFTVECNPESVTAEKAGILRKYDVNRVSLGAQAFDDGMLKKLGRRHTSSDVLKAMKILREAGITNISLDLMYSLPEQSLQDWKDTLKKAVNAEPSHISVYSLTVDEGSRFYAEGKEPLDNETEYEMYDTAIRFLEASGYEQYEISNFAKNGLESEHNKVYWYYGDFIGIGPGASGKENGVRYTVKPDLKGYLEGKREREEIPLSGKDERFEAVMMGLRLNQGIDLNAYAETFKVRLEEYYRDAVTKHISQGNLEIAEGFLRATRQGRFILHDVLVDFLE